MDTVRGHPSTLKAKLEPRRGRGGTRRLATPLLVAGVLMAPILVPPTATNSVPGDLVNLLLIVIGLAIFWGQRTRLRVPLGLSYLLVLLGGVLALTQSVAPSQAALAIAQDAYLFIWFLVIANLILDTGGRAARLVAIVWAATGVMMALVLWLPTLNFPESNSPVVFGYEMVDPFGRSEGTFRDPNLAGNYLVVSLFVMWASPRPRTLTAKLLLTPLFLLGIYATESITALAAVVGGAVAAALLGILSRSGARVGATLSIVAIGLGVVAILPPDAIVEGSRATKELGETEVFSDSVGRAGTSLGVRAQRWEDALQDFGSNILIGIGPSTADEALAIRNEPLSGELHMDYLASLIERGILGFLGVMSLFAVCLFWSVRAAAGRRVLGRDWHPAALGGAMVAVLMSAISLETLHFRHVWLLFALIVGLGLETTGRLPIRARSAVEARVLTALGAAPGQVLPRAGAR